MFGWFRKKCEESTMAIPRDVPLEERIKWQQEQITELKETLIDLIYHLGLEEDHNEPRRHVFRKRNAKREK